MLTFLQKWDTFSGERLRRAAAKLINSNPRHRVQISMRELMVFLVACFAWVERDPVY